MLTNQQYEWQHSRRYNDYSSYIKKTFSIRIQKIAVDAGFTCPNRDGSKGTGGCTYCNNKTFVPYYCEPKTSVGQQLKDGIDFFAKKYSTQKYLAYFQAFTNTYAPLEILKKVYSEALSHPSIIGLVIATRPDCMDDDKLNYLEELSKKYYIVVEYGVESCNDNTLKRINRCHTFDEAADTIKQTSQRGIHIGIHLILGLPGDNRDAILNHARIISTLPIETLKLHQLQIVKNTVLGEQYKKNPDSIKLYTADEYIDLVVDFMELLNPKIIVERFISETKSEMLLSPKWGLKNFEIVSKIEKRLKERQTWQGKNFKI